LSTLFNPGARYATVALANGERCHVFDDALLDPVALRRLASEQRQQFQLAGHNAFPGPELRMPDAFSAALEAFFATRVRRMLGGRRTLHAYSRLSLVTLPPDQLSAAQSICHRDRMRLEPGRCVAACVLYLFDDPALGGTGFYRPTRAEPDIARLVHDSGSLDASAFAASYGIERGYMTQSNAWFEKVAAVPARFNRLIFYNGMHFHSGDINAPDRLSDDPATGRLTLNGFFTCRQGAA